MTKIAAEESVYWKNGEIILEGLLNKSTGETGTIICHPHPLMGGSMYNSVVEVAQSVFAGMNCTTLRFNFRGVGASTGYFDEGRGEQEDILSACEYLKKNGIVNIILAGYSFGAWVCARLIEERKKIFTAVYLISPPCQLFDFKWVNLGNKVSGIICGDKDEFCNSDTLKAESKKINCCFESITNADHFYSGKEKQLDEAIKYVLKAEIK